MASAIEVYGPQIWTEQKIMLSTDERGDKWYDHSATELLGPTTVQRLFRIYTLHFPFHSRVVFSYPVSFRHSFLQTAFMCGIDKSHGKWGRVWNACELFPTHSDQIINVKSSNQWYSTYYMSLLGPMDRKTNLEIKIFQLNFFKRNVSK